MILKGVQDVSKQLGRAIMSATSDNFILPYIRKAQESILVRALGPEMVKELSDQNHAGNLTPANAILIEQVQSALAWYAYLKYLPFSIGNDGDNGLMEMSTEKNAPVRIGVLDRRLRESEKNAVEYLETVLLFLENNIDEYPAYKNSPSVVETRKLFLSSASIMSEFIPSIEGNYRLFITLKPHLRLCERDYILPRLGTAQYNRLKEGLINADLTEAEQDLLFAVRRYLAHMTYKIALPQMQFVLNGNGNVRILSDFDGIYNSKAADQKAIACMMKDVDTEAKKWANHLQAFLVKNIDQFPLYAQAEASKVPALNKLPKNEYKSIFRLK